MLKNYYNATERDYIKIVDQDNNAYTWRSLIDLCVVIAGGSDAPVEIGDPRIEFKAAIGRKDLDGYYQDYWNLEESVSREEALYMFTKLSLIHI